MVNKVTLVGFRGGDRPPWIRPWLLAPRIWGPSGALREIYSLLYARKYIRIQVSKANSQKGGPIFYT